MSKVSSNVIKNQVSAYSKGVLEGSSRKGPGSSSGMATSNSPKPMGNSSSNKLFLKGFHQEHQKLFNQD